MIKKWSITIPRLSGREPRNAYLYLPEDWEEGGRYPVLYMFDGHNVFFDQDATYGKSWGMADFAEENRLPLIIAAVECSHDPDNGRLKEYSPFTFDDPQFGHVPGRGRSTMEWLVKSFKPYIDQHYPTLPQREYTFIAGSSMGGLMTLYALTAYNHVFSRGAALSPSLWVAPRKLEGLIRRSAIAPGTVLYMDYGSQEMAGRGMERTFGRISGALLEKKVFLTSRIVPGGTHCEASWEQQIPFFMDTLFYGLE
ncbi:MAG: alpha/beta hydrolase-fold protein [Oscillospiraceae bacterium]|nr:alpha/beta hydrolase-fold protein [Oscillospiraceae bacterium]